MGKGSMGLIYQFTIAQSLRNDNHQKSDYQSERICNIDFEDAFRLIRYDCRISYHLSLWGVLCSRTEDTWQISCSGSSGCFVLLDVVNCICISFCSQYFTLWYPMRNRFLSINPVAVLQADSFSPSASSAVLQYWISIKRILSNVLCTFNRSFADSLHPLQLLE